MKLNWKIIDYDKCNKLLMQCYDYIYYICKYIN